MGDYLNIKAWESHDRNVAYPLVDESYDLDSLLSDAEGADVVFATPLRAVYVGDISGGAVLYLNMFGDDSDSFIPWTVAAQQRIDALVKAIGGTSRGTTAGGLIGLR